MTSATTHGRVTTRAGTGIVRAVSAMRQKPGASDNVKRCCRSLITIWCTGTVIDYLGRYSHRIAISDQRIISIDNEQVRFHYKDYACDGERKTMALDAVEFIRR